ncbi:LAFA_0G02696g1_1 [Lachancea sp. 'fantastica']|nr:LAFA_0G02696g1_1 [Lachancea sp. 'fantastica']
MVSSDVESFSYGLKDKLSSWVSRTEFLLRGKSPRALSIKAIARKYGDENLTCFQDSYSKAVHGGHAIDCPKSSETQRKDFRAPKNPIVLCHGLSGFDRLVLLPSMGQLTKIMSNHSASANSDQHMEQDTEESRLKGLWEVEYWFGVQQALEAKGCTVISTRVPGFSTIQERAKALNECIERETEHLRVSQNPDETYNVGKQETNKTNGIQKPVQVNLIAHSMGGLDCRYLISKIENKNFDVLSLTTVSTPHHGSEMADFVVRLSEDLRKGISADSKLKILPPAIYQLTTKSMEEFNKVTPDHPKVKYMSYGASMQPKWYNLFFTSWRVVHELSNGAPNDGLVSVPSSHWGEYLGTIENADHLDIINWKNKFQKEISRALAPTDSVKQGLEPDVDMLDFYLGIADNLARRGF